MASGDSKYYFDWHYPFPVVRFILGLIFGFNKKAEVDPAAREWYSQPRPGNDEGVEVITTTFKLPLSVSEISMEILRVPCLVEVLYQDRSNNWRPVLDYTRLPVRVNVARSDVRSFYKFTTKVYPIVAKQLRFQITRTNDPTLENTPFVVGLRNTLIRRNVYDRNQGVQFFEEEQDVLGNIITKYVKDWDGGRAADDDPYTFWKSQAMPDPSAVVNLFLDLRTDEGGPRTIDRVYIDPVYAGQHLNLYYSSDDTVGTRRLNPISIRPDEDVNTEWRIGSGRKDASTGLGEAYYRWRLNVGPLNQQAAWIGIEWAPDFDPTDGPPNNPVLFRAMDPDTAGLWKPLVEYDVGAGEFTLQFEDGDDTRTYSAPLTQLFAQNEPMRIVVGWRYDPDTVYLSVTNSRGVEVATLTATPSTLPQTVSFDGDVEMYRFRGLVSAMVIKLENYAISSSGFQVTPTYYTDPDPVIPDPASGEIPSTTLDNAIYAASWASQEHGSGGPHESSYENKEWTPIWRNYVAQKGMLFLPQATSMKYLKLEMTNLTEEPYPIYESGIEVRYKVFPLSVQQQTTSGTRLYTGEGGFLGLGTFISKNGVRSVNFLNPTSVIEAVGALLGPQHNPVVISHGNSYITETIPNTADLDLEESTRLEMGSQYVYRRDVLQPYVLAEDVYVTTIKAEGLQKLADFTDIPWQDIEAANPGAVTKVKSVGALPVRGTDWWIYPGQQLKIPASVMTKLTDTSTVTERKLTLESRVRFNTTAIHRYDYKTLRRDAAIGYFAGIREVIPFQSTFIAGEDKPFFDFPAYDPDQFDTVFTRQLPEGPTTTLHKLYPINNRLFERSLANWTAESGAWTWDGTVGRWLRGAARVSADGENNILLSDKVYAGEGEDIDFSIAIRWADMDSTFLFPQEYLLPSPELFPNAGGNIVGDGDPVIRWGIRYYNDLDEVVVDEILQEFSYAAVTLVIEHDWEDLSASAIVPAGATYFRMYAQVTSLLNAGTVWFESANATTADDTMAMITKTLQTTSTFAKIAVDFKDSGLWRGDSMWADISPDSESIEDFALAYYTKTIPGTIPGGKWGDTIKAWGADDAEWGSPYSVVNINVDGDRRYDDKRVLHFRRVAGAGEAGIKVKQWTNFVPGGLFRIGAVFYKPVSNDNQATVRLRRLADGVIIYEETVEAPAGRWHEFQTRFVEIPDGPDQEYEVSITLSGDDEDELFLNDLYTEIGLVRYFIQLGSGVGPALVEVSDLRYTLGRAYVVSTPTVSSITLRTAILSPKAWAYGARITPYYLK